MAMLAAKSPYPTPSLGGGSSQSTSQYSNPTISSYRSHATSARQEQTMFASPTESDFSELYDAPDAVRYALFSSLAWLLNTAVLTSTVTGTKIAWSIG